DYLRAGSAREIEPDHVGRGVVVRRHQALGIRDAEPIDESLDHPAWMRIHNGEITFFVALPRRHRRRLTRRAAHYGIDEARRLARPGNSFGQAHRSIHHRVLWNPVKKSKL